MRKRPSPLIEQFRVTNGAIATSKADGNIGAFVVDRGNDTLRIIVHDGRSWDEEGLPGEPWEHVSISLPARTPTWAELCWVKDQFWRQDETVMQLHVPECDHIDHHPYCLHLWRPVNSEIPRPPAITVGPKSRQKARDGA